MMYIVKEEDLNPARNYKSFVWLLLMNSSDDV